MKDNITKLANRRTAILAGNKTYIGRQCKLGHTERSTKNRHCIKCQNTMYATNPTYKKRRRIRMQKWQKQEDLKKQKARRAVHRAVLSGEIQKRPCEVCNVVAPIHAHHDNYDHPLTVMWLCPRHHKERHATLGIAI